METYKQENFIKPTKPFNVLYWVQRIVVLFYLMLLFLPYFNPGRISLKISKYISVFTSAFSYENMTANLKQSLTKGWVSDGTFKLLQFGSVIFVIGVLVAVVGGCMTFGNGKMRFFGNIFPVAGSGIMGWGLIEIYFSYIRIGKEVDITGKANKVEPCTPGFAFMLCTGLAVLLLILSIILFVYELRKKREEKMEMLERYKLFLYMLPIILLCVVFSYLPLWGWRYAFFDYKAGGDLLLFDKYDAAGNLIAQKNFVGFKWFTYLFQNSATKNDILRVIKNTLCMSGLGILTSWFPVAFAIFLSEIRNTGFRKCVQILTTIPNFISWVLVYSIAIAMFSTEGFINDFIELITGQIANTNFLQSADLTYIKMLLWGVWKGLGWSAIIYIAAIAGVDQSLYEAAMVDGAGRFKRMWHITVPSLVPTYCVMLMLSIANILSNGMEQYMVFSNAINKDSMEVLDLYVYNIGIGSGQIPLSTVVSMTKSVISVTLLFVANRISKAVRGESII